MKRLIVIICLITASYVNAQKLSSIFSNQELNYFQIQKQINDKIERGDSLTNKELKHYKRWQTFWANRIDENACFTTYYYLLYPQV